MKPTGPLQSVFPKRHALLRRDFTVSSQIPYTAQVTEHVVRTKWGDYVQVFRLAGVSFESADDGELNNWHERLAIALRNIASPNLALWTHVIRRRERAYPHGVFEQRFASDLNAHYKERISGERLMVNELYLSTVYRSTTGVVTSWTSKVLSRTSRDAVELDLKAALEACEKLRQTLQASLDRYDIEPLALYQHDGEICSRVLEFLGLLINGEWQRQPLPRAPVNEVLATTRPVFGVESLGIPHGDRYPVGRDLRHQGIPDADRDGHVPCAAIRTVPLGPHPVLYLPHQGERAGAPAAPVRPDVECRRSRRDAGRAA